MEADDTLYDYAPDNDGIDYTSHYSAQRPYRSQQFNSDRDEELEDPVQGNSWGRLGSLLDFVTGPRFAFVVAVVVVIVFQFQGKIFHSCFANDANYANVALCLLDHEIMK
jgi:hypothetical protein